MVSILYMFSGYGTDIGSLISINQLSVNTASSSDTSVSNNTSPVECLLLVRHLVLFQPERVALSGIYYENKQIKSCK